MPSSTTFGEDVRAGAGDAGFGTGFSALEAMVERIITREPLWLGVPASVWAGTADGAGGTGTEGAVSIPETANDVDAAVGSCTACAAEGGSTAGGADDSGVDDRSPTDGVAKKGSASAGSATGGGAGGSAKGRA